MLKNDATGVWWELNRKFSSNLELALVRERELTIFVETQARAIPVVARILEKSSGITDWQKDALCMFDEIFADITCAIYLSACALDKPAQTVLRRALEIGIATVYLWDLPHAYWGWKESDEDLTFNEMLEHMSNSGFGSLVKHQNPHFSDNQLFDISRSRVIYRRLSNIVHGKMMSFESTLPDRFQHKESDWRGQLETIADVEALLLQMWNNRFRCVSENLELEFPQLRMKGTKEHGAQN
jgi:hypothetical protein